MPSQDQKHVVLLHISDIHFRADESGAELDPHKLARHELITDAREKLPERSLRRAIAVAEGLSAKSSSLTFGALALESGPG